MKTSELLHFAFCARDPLALGRRYAGLFELFPNVDNMPLLSEGLGRPEHRGVSRAEIRAGFAELARDLDPADGIPLLLFESHIRQQQQQQQQ